MEQVGSLPEISIRAEDQFVSPKHLELGSSGLTTETDVHGLQSVVGSFDNPDDFG